MTTLCDEMLIESYRSAIEHGLEIAFIQILQAEINRRNLSFT